MNPINIDLQCTRIFYENWNCNNEVICNRGGARSSKSYSIAQKHLLRFLQGKKRKILILRKTLPSLRITTLPLMRGLIRDWGLTGEIKEEKRDLNFHYKDNLIHFGSLDDAEKIKCFHGDTDILTVDGWKNVKEIKVGDVVASINPTNGNAEYKKVSNTWIYDFDGHMISSASYTGDRRPYADFCVTPEHKILTRRTKNQEWRLKKAYELPSCGHYRLRQAANWDNVNTQIVHEFEIDKGDFNHNHNRARNHTNIFDANIFLKFLGWFLSEGCLDKDGCTITIHQMKPEGRKQLKKDLQDFPYTMTEYKKYFALYGKDLWNYLSQFGLQHERFIPRDIMNLHNSQLKHLFHALMKGDGHKYRNGRWNYATTSKRLADDVNELAIKLGYASSIRYLENPGGKLYPNAKPAYIVTIVDRVDVGLSKTEKTYYKGKVYCIEVPPYHTVLSRYNGKTVWIGQSSDWNDIWMEEATEFTYEEFLVLKTRLSAPIFDNFLNQITLSFNPVDAYHFIKLKIIEGEEDVKEIVSTYRDNPFLSEAYIKVLKKLKKQDKNFWRIYAQGEWGRLEHLIYNNYKVIREWADSFDDDGYGLDFGYNNETALIYCGVKDREQIYTKQLIYQSGLTNEMLIRLMDKLKIDKNKPIYADSAKPTYIQEIANEGYNIMPAKKDVLEGIDAVKRHTLMIDGESPSILEEAQAYSWRVDRRGIILEEPVKFKDHGMDAIRYFVYNHLYGGRKYAVYFAD